MDTGYWIEKGSIHGPRGYTGYRLNRRKQIIGRQGYTRHWLWGDHIYSTMEGNTGYWVEKDRIFGPAPELPWEQRMVQRVKRAKSRAALRKTQHRSGS